MWSFVRLKVQNPEGRDAPVYEKVPVEDYPDRKYLVLRSPVLLEDIARGDLIEVEEDGTFLEILKGGGNICVQFFRTTSPSATTERALTREVESNLKGTLDAEHPGCLVFTIPLKENGFKAIEDVFNLIGGCDTWMYDNVYNPIAAC